VADSLQDAPQALQHAALKAIDAMRGLLDAAEDVVADPRNLEDAVSGVSAWTEKMAASFGGGRGDAEEDGAGQGGAGEGGAGEGGGDDSVDDEADEAATTTRRERLRRIPLD
jgi:hypothetical protein